MSKKTGWYPADVKPTRAGWYEVRRFVLDGVQMKPHMLEWSGIGWRYAYKVMSSSAGDFALVSKRDGDMWRGLTAPK